jgi:hypothetical protein
MARTRGPARKRVWPRRVIVLSLLLQNPTTVEQRETTREPAPGARLTKRARTQSRRLAAVITAILSEEILVWEIFVRLPAKYIIRCRAVCRYWYNLTSTHDFLLANHRFSYSHSRAIAQIHSWASPPTRLVEIQSSCVASPLLFSSTRP